MGFRSTFTSDAWAKEWPAWFKGKHGAYLHINDGQSLSTKNEIKLYDDEIFKDIQRVLPFCCCHERVRLCALHECGGVTLVDIRPDSIEYLEFQEGSVTKRDFITHEYCYGCTEDNPPSESPGE
jgi:hypothetical protein